MKLGALGEWVVITKHTQPTKQGALFLPGGANANAWKVEHVGSFVNKISITPGEIVFVANETNLIKATYGVDQGMLAHQSNLIGFIQDEVST